MENRCNYRGDDVLIGVGFGQGWRWSRWRGWWPAGWRSGGGVGGGAGAAASSAAGGSVLAATASSGCLRAAECLVVSRRECVHECAPGPCCARWPSRTTKATTAFFDWMADPRKWCASWRTPLLMRKSVRGRRQASLLVLRRARGVEPPFLRLLSWRLSRSLRRPRRSPSPPLTATPHVTQVVRVRFFLSFKITNFTLGFFFFFFFLKFLQFFSTYLEKKKKKIYPTSVLS